MGSTVTGGSGTVTAPVPGRAACRCHAQRRIHCPRYRRRVSSHRALRLALLASVVAVGGLLGACTAVSDTVDDAGGGAAELSERARFCIAVARTVSAIESGSPATARQAAEELYAQAPDELRDDIAVVIEAVEAGDAAALDEPRVAAAASRLRAETEGRCAGVRSEP